MDDKINGRHQDQRKTTGQGDAHLLRERSIGCETKGSWKPLPTRKRDQKGSYVLVGTPEEANLGRDQNLKDKDDTEGVSAVSKPSGILDSMAGTLVVSSPRDARSP
eukprot:2011814-Pleurochrysis_carterae.AAC.2